MPASAPAPAAPATSSRSIFAIPSPIRSLFNHFPLHTYPEEALPSSSATTTKATAATSPSTTALSEPITTPRLYIFTSPDHQPSAPSPNPTCLKHQTYLRAARIPHDCLPSTNHASPSGALPFLLLPALSQTASASSPPSLSNVPLTGGRIVSYARKHAGSGDEGKILSDLDGDELEVKNSKLEAYRALISQSIRPAWVRTPLLRFPPSLNSLYHSHSVLHSSTISTCCKPTPPFSPTSTSQARQPSPTPGSSIPSAPPPQPRSFRRPAARPSTSCSYTTTRSPPSQPSTPCSLVAKRIASGSSVLQSQAFLMLRSLHTPGRFLTMRAPWDNWIAGFERG